MQPSTHRPHNPHAYPSPMQLLHFCNSVSPCTWGRRTAWTFGSRQGLPLDGPFPVARPTRHVLAPLARHAHVPGASLCRTTSDRDTPVHTQMTASPPNAMPNVAASAPASVWATARRASRSSSISPRCATRSRGRGSAKSGRGRSSARSFSCARWRIWGRVRTTTTAAARIAAARRFTGT